MRWSLRLCLSLNPGIAVTCPHPASSGFTVQTRGSCQAAGTANLPRSRTHTFTSADGPTQSLWAPAVCSLFQKERSGEETRLLLLHTMSPVPVSRDQTSVRPGGAGESIFMEQPCPCLTSTSLPKLQVTWAREGQHHVFKMLGKLRYAALAPT